MIDPQTAIAVTLEGLRWLRDKHKADAETLQKLGQLQDALYQLREENLRLQDENHRLKQQAEERQKFEESYGLVTTTGGATVYKFKGEPEHYACPNCKASKSQTQILQDARNAAGSFRCPGCDKYFRIKTPPRLDPQIRPRAN